MCLVTGMARCKYVSRTCESDGGLTQFCTRPRPWINRKPYTDPSPLGVADSECLCSLQVSPPSLARHHLGIRIAHPPHHNAGTLALDHAGGLKGLEFECPLYLTTAFHSTRIRCLRWIEAETKKSFCSWSFRLGNVIATSAKCLYLCVFPRVDEALFILIISAAALNWLSMLVSFLRWFLKEL